MLFVNQRLYDGKVPAWGDLCLAQTAHLDPAIHDRGIIGQGAVADGAKGDLQTGLPGADQRWRIRPDEPFGKIAHFVIPAALDIDAAEHRTQPRDPLRRNLGLDDPEGRAGVDKGGDILVHADRRDDLAQTGGKADFLDPANGHVTVTQFGLARLDAGPFVKFDKNHRTAGIIAAERNAQSRNQRQDRNDPDDRRAAQEQFARGFNLNLGWRVRHVDRGPHRKHSCPRSVWSRRPVQKAW